MKPKIIVFASGTKNAGGSGFENLVEHSHGGDLDADIVAVVSNHEHGGVAKRAKRLNVPFEYFPGPFDAGHYQAIVGKYVADWIALSGWLKQVVGLHPTRTFNIHPALLSFQNRRFGGQKLFGHHVHDAVKAALDAGEITESGLTMHFVIDGDGDPQKAYDRGPIFFEYRVPLTKGMSADDIAEVVNKAEHAWQPRITNKVVHGKIALVGDTVVTPVDYGHMPRWK